MQAAALPPRRPDPGLQIIAVIKMVKGLLLLGIALGAFHLINRDLAEVIHRLARQLRIDPENHYLRALLDKTQSLHPHFLRNLGIGFLVFAADMFAEGIGLWLNQAWAKYLVVNGTGLFLPGEVYECVTKFTWARAGLLIVNAAVFAYVAQFLWRKRPTTA